jgi:hypothetical protein
MSTDVKHSSIGIVEVANRIGNDTEFHAGMRRIDLTLLQECSQTIEFAFRRLWAFDPRCQMITLDPDTATPNPAILRKVAQGHDGTAGVYGAVLAEGIIRPGDPVAVLG